MTELTNVNVILTRSKDQAYGLAKAIIAHCGNPVLFPTIEIVPIRNTFENIKQIDEVAKFDIAIFTSFNAVTHFEHELSKLEEVSIFAIGPTTARALQERGVKKVFFPEKNYDSEHLLESMFDLVGKRILLVSGMGGREFLAEQLIKHGALVTKCAVYRRLQPQISEQDAKKVAQLPNSIIVSTSCESLANLQKMMKQFQLQNWLMATPIIVISSRMQNYALKLGIDKQLIIKSENATDSAILDSLIKCYPIS